MRILSAGLRWVERTEVAVIEDTKFVSITKQGNFHGMALWFDVSFNPLVYEDESNPPFNSVELKTGPNDPETHWKQTVMVVMENFAQAEVEEDEIIGWTLKMSQSRYCCTDLYRLFKECCYLLGNSYFPDLCRIT